MLNREAIQKTIDFIDGDHIPFTMYDFSRCLAGQIIAATQDLDNSVDVSAYMDKLGVNTVQHYINAASDAIGITNDQGTSLFYASSGKWYTTKKDQAIVLLEMMLDRNEFVPWSEVL